MADLIDREPLLKGMDSVLRSMWQKYATDPYLNKVVGLVQIQRDFVAAQPTRDPESLRPKGVWDRSGYCSICDFWTCYCGDYNFCPNCGADMRGDT